MVTFSKIYKKINFVNKGVKNLLDLDKKQKLFIKNAGIKLFKANKKKNENTTNFCFYRVCQDGLMYLLPFMHKRIILVNEIFFKEILRKKDIKHEDITDEDLKGYLKEIGNGCVVLVNAKQISNKNKKEDENYNNYLKNNFIDAICCHNAETRIILMVNTLFIFFKFNVCS